MSGRKKKSAVTYQPRKMILKKNGRSHVLGMSLTRLNISLSYKNKIKTLLENNKALARMLAVMQHELTLKDKEILLLKKNQTVCCPDIVAMKNKLHTVCDHMNSMVGLMDEVFSMCNSEPASSAQRGHDTCVKNPEARNSLCPLRKEVVPMTGLREEHWVNDMTVIEEQSFIDTNPLPPMRFTDEMERNEIRERKSTSQISGSSLSSGENCRHQSSRGSRRSSLFSVYSLEEQNRASRSSSGLSSRALASLETVNDEVRPAKQRQTLEKVDTHLSQNDLCNDPKASYDNDITTIYNSSLIMQGIGPVVQESEDNPSEVTFSKPTEKQDDSGKVVAVPVEVLTTLTVGENNKTCHLTEDMELTETVDVPLLDAPNVECTLRNKPSQAKKKDLDLSVSFCDQSINIRNDPDYFPMVSKKNAKSISRMKKSRTANKVTSEEEVTHKFFSTAPRRNRNTSNSRSKVSKVQKHQEEKKDKRDVEEFPSAVFDYSGDTSAVFQPFKSVKKPLPVKKTVVVSLKDDDLEKGTEAVKSKPRASLKRKPKQKQIDTELTKENVAPSTLSDRVIRSSQGSEHLNDGQVGTEQVFEAPVSKKKRASSLRSASETGLTPEGHKTGCRRATSCVTSYREPKVNRKMRR